MITTTGPNASAATLLEITMDWADGRPPVVARIDDSHARRLVAQLAFAAPDELESAVTGASSEAATLLLGVQAFCRHLFDRGDSLALADVEGTSWIVPTRSVRAISLRLVAVPARTRATSVAVGLRSAFCSAASGETNPC